MIPVFGISRLRMGLDGSGVRTLVGTAGCSLRCRFCLNPHAWDSSAEAVPYTPAQLYEAVRVDSLYFQATGGGVTFGGGEPLLHMDGIAEFAALCPAGWSLWAETALNLPRTAVQRAAEVFDHFVVDIKTTDPALYRRYTGAELAPALGNLAYLLDTVGPARVTVRVPCIPGFADEASRRRSADAVRALGAQTVDEFTYILR